MSIPVLSDLVRSSSGTSAFTVGSGGGGSGASGRGTLDFGALPGAADAALVVTAQAGIGAGSVPEAFLLAEGTTDHSADEHRVIAGDISLTCGNIVPGVGFTIYASVPRRTYGALTVGWRWA